MRTTYELVATLPANGYQIAFLDEQDGTVLDDATPVLGFLLLVHQTSDAATMLVPVTTEGPVDREIMSRYVLIRPDGKVEGQLDDCGTYTSIADYNAQTLQRRAAHLSH
jgi:hypothetical protein